MSQKQGFKYITQHAFSNNCDPDYELGSEGMVSFIPLNKLLPANQILSKDVEGDNQAKIIMKNKYQDDNKKERQLMETFAKSMKIGILNLEQKLCFQEEDCLGYEFQAKFQRLLVYSRIMGSISHKQWLKFMTYAIHSDNNKQKTQSIKYLAGLFTNQNRQSFDESSPVQKLNTPHLLQNNLCIITNAEEKNYQPNLIRFSGSYPSANLMYVFRTGFNQFSLILHNDTNSKGSTQWFNFSIILPQKHLFDIIKFSIVNLTKSSSIYSKGMKVVYKRKKDINWRKLPTQPEYHESEIDIEGRQQGIKYRTLSFYYNTKLHKPTSKNGEDTISFAYGYPYTLQDNHKFWSQFDRSIPNIKRNKHKMSVKRQVIGKSVSGIPIEVYKICQQQKRKSLSTATSLNWLSTKLITPSKYKSIVFLARQHPGETQGSYITQGIVEFLNNSQSHLNVKKHFVYHFIPIVNVEGVLLGNYRTNIKGYDLNRNWRNPVSQAQPQVIAIKKYLLKINKENQICLIIDLHGHSKALNSFFYGVMKAKNNKQNPKFFPYFCSKKMKQVSFEQSYFHISQDKKNTARAVLSEYFPKALVYTLQSSFYGYEVTQGTQTKIIQYTPSQLRKFGSQLISTYLEYSLLQLDQKNPSSTLINKGNIGNKAFGLNKELLEKQIKEFQDKNEKNNEKQVQSDSQAQKQLIDIENTLIKAQQQQIRRKTLESEKNKNKNPEKPKKTIIISSNTTTMNRQKGHTFAMRGQGRYLKTIQMIDTTRSQLNDDLYIHKYDRDKQKDSYIKLRQSRKIVKKSMQKTQQKENTFYNQYKQSMPLLSVNMIKPRESEKAILKRNQPNTKMMNLNDVKFMNEKELAFQQLKMRRNNGINQRNTDLTTSIIKNGLNNNKMIGTENVRKIHENQFREKMKAFNIKFY